MDANANTKNAGMKLQACIRKGIAKKKMGSEELFACTYAGQCDNKMLFGNDLFLCCLALRKGERTKQY